MPDNQFAPVVKGQIWNWNKDVRCYVIRVARDGTWADMRCWRYTTDSKPWSKRMPLPLPDSFTLTQEYYPS